MLDMIKMTLKLILEQWVSENAAHLKPLEPCLTGVYFQVG